MTDQPDTARLHIGRSFPGMTNDIEAACPCPKAPCGLVIQEQITEACRQHHWSAAKTMRQSHPADACPGAAAVSSAGVVQLPPTNQAALRDRIAEALEHGPVRCPLSPCPVVMHTPEGARAHLTNAHPEPAPVDRAAVLLEAAAEMLAVRDRLITEPDITGKFLAGMERAARELRCMATEAPATEEQDCPACGAGIEHDAHCPTPESHNWGCGCPTDRIHLFAETGEDTPGCDCGHEGMGMRWHSKACAWIKQMTEDARALLAEDDPDAVVQPAQPHNDETPDGAEEA